MSFRWNPVAVRAVGAVAAVAAVVAVATASVAVAGTTPDEPTTTTATDDSAVIAPPPPPTSSTPPTEPLPTEPVVTTSEGTITVAGTGTVQVEPDTAVVNLGVQATAPTGAEATDSVNAAATALTDALIAAGIAEDNIQTAGLNLYSVTGDDGTTITGYNASLSINVTIDDVEAVGSTIDAAQSAAGAGFTIGGVTFSFADPESVLAQARVDALASARAKAEQYAAAAGVELGEIIAIVESPSSPPILYAAAGQTAAPANDAAGPPIDPGQLDLTIDIAATYAIA